jgi:hypothetical protein
MSLASDLRSRRRVPFSHVLDNQRKLVSPEYKDVDEQYRVATIKKETTHIAADDLKKYEKALDQVSRASN